MAAARIRSYVAGFVFIMCSTASASRPRDQDNDVQSATRSVFEMEDALGTETRSADITNRDSRQRRGPPRENLSVDVSTEAFPYLNDGDNSVSITEKKTLHPRKLRSAFARARCSRPPCRSRVSTSPPFVRKPVCASKTKPSKCKRVCKPQPAPPRPPCVMQCVISQTIEPPATCKPPPKPCQYIPPPPPPCRPKSYCKPPPELVACDEKCKMATKPPTCPFKCKPPPRPPPPPTCGPICVALPPPCSPQCIPVPPPPRPPCKPTCVPGCIPPKPCKKQCTTAKTTRRPPTTIWTRPPRPSEPTGCVPKCPPCQRRCPPFSRPCGCHRRTPPCHCRSRGTCKCKKQRSGAKPRSCAFKARAQKSCCDRCAQW